MPVTELPGDWPDCYTQLHSSSPRSHSGYTQLTQHLCRYSVGSSGATEEQELPKEGEFGFTTLDRTHTLKSFNAAADWVKARHFSRDSQPSTVSCPAFVALQVLKRTVPACWSLLQSLLTGSAAASTCVLLLRLPSKGVLQAARASFALTG